MKTLVVAGLFMLGSSFQAFSMGHPHNVFAARKHMRTKSAVVVVTQKADVRAQWQQAVQNAKTIVGTAVASAFSHSGPLRSL